MLPWQKKRPPPPSPKSPYESIDTIFAAIDLDAAFTALPPIDPLSVLAAFFGLVAFVVLAAVYARKTKSSSPKNYRKFVRTQVEHKQASCTTDAFKERKLPQDIDYIFIGSGIGSLYCAGLLAKAGYKVVVLEQHYVAGGCMHSFEDHGYEFDTGLHYVGRIEKYKLLLDLVSAPGHEVEWAKMGSAADGFAYDQIKLGDEPPHWFRAGEAAFVEDLVKRFPNERTAIERYAALVQKVNKSADLYFYAKLFHPLLQRLINYFLCASYFEYASQTAADVVASLTADEKLRALLCSQCKC